MATITLTHGLDNEVTRTVADGTPLADVLTSSLLQVLGVGDLSGQDVLANGNVVDPKSYAVFGETEVSFRAKAGDKGSC
jgi:hypothetical protein